MRLNSSSQRAPLRPRLRQDLKFAVRSLLRTPAFTSITLLVIALGIGVNTSVFSLVNAMLFAPPSYAHPGEIVQVFAQKSYPWHESRPQDEAVDGGLTLQVGIHAARFVEHVTGIRISSLDLIETTHGNPTANGQSVSVTTVASADSADPHHELDLVDLISIEPPRGFGRD